MYIAFKWLVSLTLLMWVSMCFLDCLIKGKLSFKNMGAHTKRIVPILFKNLSVDNDFKVDAPKKVQSHVKETNVPYYISMFLAGAFSVSVFNKKEDIILFAQKQISDLNLYTYTEVNLENLKITALTFALIIIKYSQFFGKTFKTYSMRIYDSIKAKRPTKQNRMHLILLKKLKEMGEERKNLGQLLIAAIHENKNIRMRYQLETLTKNRLVQHIEQTQKQIKENRSRYVSFQQLYLVTHQENSFLKARIRKLKNDKDEAEKNLMGLINEIYRSHNKELQSYCTRFIVKSKEKLLNSDVNAEITEFLESSRASRVNLNSVTGTQNWPGTSITEVFNGDDRLVPLVSGAPKLKGLPGEYVWTVKDKNGIIEKLYECDYQSFVDNRDTIKRIRQYSVYYDKDCLLDLSKMDQESECELLNSRSNLLEIPLKSQNIVTGSAAFQKFLKNNAVLQAKSSSLSLLCK